MSNRFTEIAERGLNNAVGLAQGFGHTYIGSEHILFSLSKEKAGSAFSVLIKKRLKQQSRIIPEPVEKPH